MEMKNIGDVYPLAPMQQGIFFHTLYAPHSGVYFIQLSCSLHGNLNLSAFEHAWQQVLERHSILRTAFLWEGLREPLQIVHRRVKLAWVQHDWRGLHPSEQAKQWEAFLQADRDLGFNLAQAPLMRIAVIQIAEERYDCLWSHHHLLLDGWSSTLLLKEVFAFYQAFSQGENIQLKQSPPYRDYIAWLGRQNLSKAQVFWQRMLKGFTTPTPLRIGRTPQSDARSEHRYEQLQTHLSTTTTIALQTVARQHQLTLNTLVQGAWALLLSHYSGERDIVFGATVSGRPVDLPESEAMVGLFINTLPVRVQVSPEMSLFVWLKELQSQQVEAREYEYSPLVDIQGWSEVPRGLPLFESILVFENYPIDTALQKQQSNLEIQNVRFLERTNYPLTVVAVPGSELRLRILYDGSRFDSDMIIRMIGHLQALLTGISTATTQTSADIPILTENERYELLIARNTTTTDFDRDRCYHQLFEDQVIRTPDAVAIVYDDQILTYHELNSRANQLAYYLQSLGVESEVCVGLCMNRSLDMLVGLLGILKAGGAFLPLDPILPGDRLAFMIQDSQVPVLLTQSDICIGLPDKGTRTIYLDTEWPSISLLHTENLLGIVTAENLCYIIYTSGSTGRPKGVLIPHRGLVNYLAWCIEAYTAAAGSGAPVQSSIAADAIFPSLFAPLLVGTSVTLLPETEALAALAKILVSQGGFSLIKITPSQLEVLNAQLPSEVACGWVQTLVVGAEALRGEVLRYWQRHVPETVLLNEYGPTETVVGCSCYQIQVGKPIAGAVPIGLPIANTQFYVLDQAMQLVPIGVPGELYIGGDGVAWGYLNRPELTAERFVPDLFSEQPGARLYKTGDQVCYLPERAANIEFLGRLDEQVKIRGHRVELGEVEATLAAHPGVREVVVVAQTESSYTSLVAYIVPANTTVPTISEFRSFLSAKLPDYMIPSIFMFLSAIPLTATGKCDRRALPLPNQTRPLLPEMYVVPRTSVEVSLAEILVHILKLDRIGTHDNFFDLGGALAIDDTAALPYSGALPSRDFTA